MQNAVSVKRQRRESLRIHSTYLATCKCLSFHFSFSHSLDLLSQSLTLFFSTSLSLLLSQSLYPTQVIPPFSVLLSFFSSLFFLLSLSLSRFLSFLSQSVTRSIRPTLSLSPFLALCIFPFLFQSLSLSFFLTPTHSFRHWNSLRILAKLANFRWIFTKKALAKALSLVSTKSQHWLRDVHLR